MRSYIILVCLIKLLHLVEIECTFCYKATYGRGAGYALSECRDGEERNGALCYPKCRDGYTGAGPVCWEDCREGYDNHGATCFINAHIYGKGCCCSSFDPGCCIGKCKTGYTDDGCTCRKNVEIYFKNSYGRGVGAPMVCASGLEQSGGLCYDKCRTGFVGVGPVCWEECGGNYPYSCGAVFCAADERICYSQLAKITANGLALLVSGAAITGGSDLGLISGLTGIIGSSVGLASPLILDTCNIPKS